MNIAECRLEKGRDLARDDIDEKRRHNRKFESWRCRKEESHCKKKSGSICRKNNVWRVTKWQCMKKSISSLMR